MRKTQKHNLTLLFITLSLCFLFAIPAVAQQQTQQSKVTHTTQDFNIGIQREEQVVLESLGTLPSSSNPIEQFEKFQVRDQAFNLKAGKTEKTHLSKVRYYSKPRKLTPKVFTIEHFKTKDRVNFALQYLDVSCGLPSNKITSIVEDSYGNIWLAFNGGVAQLSSNTIRIYDVSTGFPDFPITKIELHNNELYIGTFGGGLLHLVDNKLYTYSIKNGFCTDLIEDLKSTPKGLYIGTYGKGLLYLSKQGVCYHVHSEHLSSKSSAIVHSIDYSGGKLIFTQGKGYAILSGETIQLIDESTNLPEAEYLLIRKTANGDVYLNSAKNLLIRIHGDRMLEYRDRTNPLLELNTIYVGNSGTVWLGTEGSGLFKVDDLKFSRISRDNGLSDNYPSCLYQDKFDNLWIGTKNEGVNLFSPSNFFGILTNQNIINALCVLPDNSIVYEHEKGGITIRTREKETHFFHFLLKSINGIVYNEKNNQIYISTKRDLFSLKNGVLTRILISSKGESINSPMFLSLDRTGRLWINDYNYGVFSLSNSKVTSYTKWSSNTNTLTFFSFQDSKGNNWVCGDKGNISCFSDEKITSFKLSIKGNLLKIYSGCEAQYGVYYFGTNAGLVKYENGSFKKIDIPLIVKNEKIQSVIFDNRQQAVWIATQNGLIQYKNNTCVYFNESSGIPSGSFLLNTVSPYYNGFVWSTSQGLVYYIPFDFSNSDLKRIVRLEKLNLHNDKTSWDKVLKKNQVRFDDLSNNIPTHLELPEELNGLDFVFSCTNWGKEKETRFFYRLSKKGKWIPFSSDGRLSLTNLSGGTYTLEVKAGLPQNNKSIICSYRFNVLTPFYKELWFLLTVSLFILLCFWIILRKFSSFTFDQFSALGNESSALQRIRLISYFILFYTLIVTLFHGEFEKQYIVNWPLNLTLITITIGTLVYSFFQKRNVNFLNKLITVVYSLTLLIFLERTVQNYFHFSLIIELSVLLLLVVFIIKDVKNMLIFGFAFLVLGLILVTWSDAETENKIIFVSATSQVLIAVTLFARIETKNLAKILFSDKLLNSSEQFILVADTSGQIVYINKFTAENLGFEEQDALGEGWWKLRGRNDVEIKELKNAIVQGIKSGKSQEYTNVFVNLKTDKQIYISWQDTPIEGKYMLGIGKDISIELAQKAELEKLSIVAKNVTNGVLITSLDNEIEWANESFLKIMEYGLSELLGKQPELLFSGKQTDTVSLHKLYQTSENTNVEILQYTKTGVPKWFLVQITTVTNDAEIGSKKIHVITDITADIKLKERHSYILENAGDMIYTTNLSGKFDFLNSAVNEVLGYMPSELIGKHFTHLIVEEDQEKILKYYLNQLKNEVNGTYQEFRVYAANRDIKWVGQKVTFIYDEMDTVCGFQAIVHDITLSKELELEKASRAESTELYSSVLACLSTQPLIDENSLDEFIELTCHELANATKVARVSIWLLEGENLICASNNSSKEYRINILKPANYPVYFQNMEADLSIISSEPLEAEILSEFHGLFELNNIASLIHVPIRSNGKMVGVLCCESIHNKRIWTEQDIQFTKSITDLVSVNLESDKRRKAELVIQESEANFRMLNETIDDVFWLYDIESAKTIYISPSCNKILGVSENEFYTTNNYWTNYILEEDKPLIQQAHLDILEKDGYDIEYRIEVNGTIRWIHEKSFAIRNDDGKAIKSSGICTDITSRKEIEKQIKQLSVVAQKTRNPIVISNPDGKIEWVNEAFETLTQFSLVEVLSMKPGSFLQGTNTSQKTVKKIREGLRKRSSVKEELINYKKDGTEYWVELNIDPIFNEEGKLINYIAVEQDITDRKRKEELIESQHLDIINSINYAKRIQTALLPSQVQFDNLNIEVGLINQPKDIIGGDFYWCEQKDNTIILAVGDCTGHGVPGALMTSLGINGLINAVSEQGMTNPADILNYLDTYIFNMLSKDNPDEQVNDGMDIGIISIDLNTNRLLFSGAGRPMYAIKGNNVSKSESSRRTIGTNMSHIPYETTQLVFEDGVSYHLFTDGMTDQFGGPNNKRIGSRKFISRLEQLSHLSMNEIEVQLSEHMDNWMQHEEQTDDMIWMAIRKQ